jgi:tRNA (cytidine/uridine-2'-O-)-methyltransferase
LYQPEIPQNTGNIGRTCVALNAKLWLVRPLGFRLDHSRLRRAGLDYWDALQWEDVADWQQLIERLGAAPLWLFSKGGSRLYDEIEYPPGSALVFGSESRGLPASLLQASSQTVRIPMDGPVRSLNLSNAVAIAGYQARRK